MLLSVSHTFWSLRQHRMHLAKPFFVQLRELRRGFILATFFRQAIFSCVSYPRQLLWCFGVFAVAIFHYSLKYTIRLTGKLGGTGRGIVVASCTPPLRVKRIVYNQRRCEFGFHP